MQIEEAVVAAEKMGKIDQRISVCMQPGFHDLRASDLTASIRTYLSLDVDVVQIVQVYTICKNLLPEELEGIAQKVLIDPITEMGWNGFPPLLQFDWTLEIRLKAGLTDNLGMTAQISIEDFLGTRFAQHEKVSSSVQYLLKGNLTRADVHRIGKELLANPIIEEISVATTFEILRAEGSLPCHAPLHFCAEIEIIDIAKDEEALIEMSQTRQLALQGNEMVAIRSYYSKEETLQWRARYGLPPNPTDVELQAIAQTWSEHCKHKIFNASICYRDENGEKTIDGLFPTYIKKVTEEMADKIDWLISTFEDNAGIIRFNGTTDLTCKVETHNSPSALDPYGGALTGILGVNRDILGTGKGSRPIANMDVLCFAPPDYSGAIPEKLIHPKRVMEGVCKGIEHGGNKSGIPTVNGAILFDERYLGKPLVYCGTIGLIPPTICGQPNHIKEIIPGDWIVVAGGRTGKDGIQGATFSSQELHAQSSSSAVQIGDPFTQKKLHDFLLEARDLGLYRTLTDNGAGGLSSSVGELALLCGGCEIHLDRVPLKYPHLHPWEILLSESQERMTFSVDPSCLEKLEELAAFHEVEMAAIGTFTQTGFFHVLWEGKAVALLSLDFLHRGVPQMQLEAEWNPPEQVAVSISSSDLGRELHQLLSRFSICSKESIVRRYDCEVQGASMLKPMIGDAAILLPMECIEQGEGIVVSNGICPSYSDIDTYAMATAAVDEAVRNQVAVGGDPGRIAILDNFCWPDPIDDREKNPDGKHKLAQLVRAAMGLYDAAKAFHTPIISGKDSMKNDYKIGDVKISVPPTLLITAIGKIPCVEKAVSMDVKQPGDLIYIVGLTRQELGGSEYLAMKQQRGGIVPHVDLIAAKKIYHSLFGAMQEELIASCHDCSEGGLAVALAESAFAGGYGVDVDLRSVPTEDLSSDGEILFSESTSRFIMTIDPQWKEAFEAKMESTVFAQIGIVRNDLEFNILGNSGDVVVREEIDDLKKSWQSPLERKNR
ncbi:MAG: phosphoribosylformylglycinamidine synthase subunit PurL [Rhabdochlamydiaceae bacterium]